MTNREKLLHTNIYDLLCRMQRNLDRDDISRCVLDVITGEEQDCFAGDCSKCIAEWLNEEAKRWTKST